MAFMLLKMLLASFSYSFAEIELWSQFLPSTCSYPGLLYLSLIAAGNAYRQAARVFKKLTWNHEAATTLVDAGNLMKDSDPLGAVECYREASGLFMELGRFMVAAKHLQTIAEIYEARGGDSDTEKVCFTLFHVCLSVE